MVPRCTAIRAVARARSRAGPPDGTPRASVARQTDPEHLVVDDLVAIVVHRHRFRQDRLYLVGHDAELAAVAPSVAELG